MQEYKFRGRRIDNGEWVHGCLTRYSDYMSYITVDLVEGKVHQVLTATVGQYTGLKDKCGREIYEGDIVRCYEEDYGDEWVAKILYCADRDYPAFELEPCPDVDCNAISYYQAAGVIEVIGNVHEHRYLLDPEIQKHICSGEPPF